MALVDSENSTARPADPIYPAIETHRAAYAGLKRNCQRLTDTQGG
jgi:hypothetical protein